MGFVGEFEQLSGRPPDNTLAHLPIASSQIVAEVAQPNIWKLPPVD
jgi:hypothetical protein